MTRLLLQLDDLAYNDQRDDQYWVIAQRSWRTVVTFFDTYLLKFLRPLSNVLSGAFAEEHFDPDERRWVERLSSPDPARHIAELGTALLDLRKPRARGDEIVRAELVKDLDVLHRTVLAAGSMTDELARLAHFLETCPAILGDTLRARLNAPEIVRLPLRPRLVDERQADLTVFCPDELLGNTIQHLLENAGGRKHRAPGREAVPVELEISIATEDDLVRVRFRNDGTVSTAAPGKGIALIERKLLDFGGALNPVPPSGRWSYEIELRLPLWAVEPWKE